MGGVQVGIRHCPGGLQHFTVLGIQLFPVLGQVGCQLILERGLTQARTLLGLGGQHQKTVGLSLNLLQGIIMTEEWYLHPVHQALLQVLLSRPVNQRLELERILCQVQVEVMRKGNFVIVALTLLLVFQARVEICQGSRMFTWSLLTVWLFQRQLKMGVKMWEEEGSMTVAWTGFLLPHQLLLLPPLDLYGDGLSTREVGKTG